MYCIKYLKIEFHRHNNPTKVQNSGKIISFVKKNLYFDIHLKIYLQINT